MSKKFIADITLTEMAEGLQTGLNTVSHSFCFSEQSTRLFDRHFKEMFEDFKVKLEEQIEHSIEEEETDFYDIEDTTETETEAFGNVTMEGE